ncbi:MAG: low temperature requirement protein A [Solirubrobacterales bacterium]|nr:low temperature requirement protein A [Solirubrobacterales bacterium]MBV9367733.1 low temperature requirement protein A [Solirubrobacterales bacterium]MBV9685476.1 low temperature requirement protein A [Solirubrobacterales bacterium]MBV9810680.1 low temperature requirement protein A [Solirubrobacterales bacterium]
MSDRPIESPDERRTAPIELLWDLVFVFAITQVTTLLWRDLTWAGFGRAMLVLALVWWAWSAYVWAANAQDPGSPTLRGCLLLSSISIFVAGLSVPHAFGSEATLFAVSYAVVRFLHLALYADASRKGNAAWSAIAGFALTVAIGMALLIAGSFADGALRIVLWVLAAAIDYAGPAWLTRERLRGLQRVAVAHFAERYSLFVIICLGESIVAIGVGALGPSTERALSGELVVAVALGLLITVAMWWTYFEGFAETAAERLRDHDDPVLAAADAYSYLHLVIVAGIITFAVGIKVLTRDSVSAPLPGPARLVLCGGVALYLLGSAAFALRMIGRLEYEKLAVAAALLALYAITGAIAAWAVAAAVAALVVALCAVESDAVRRVMSGRAGEASSTASERMIG